MLQPWEEGEILVFGACVSSGFEDPRVSEFLELGGQRCFRSGDLGRWETSWEGGDTLLVVGRCNQMVKLRGQRVELALVELALTSSDLGQLIHPSTSAGEDEEISGGVSSSTRGSGPIFVEAACLLDHPGDCPHLVAAVVLTEPHDASVVPAARRALRELLPPVAVPDRLVPVTQMPRLPGGRPRG